MMRSFRPPRDLIWQAPLFPIAVALTAGMTADRLYPLPLSFTLTAALIGSAAWIVSRQGTSRPLSFLYLGLAVAGFGAAWHRRHLDQFPQNEISRFASVSGEVCRVRGEVLLEPIRTLPGPDTALHSIPPEESASALVNAHALELGRDWQAVSGKVRIQCGPGLPAIHAGDLVELTGILRTPSEPANPGEFDQAAQWRDQRIRALLVVRSAEDSVEIVQTGWRRSASAWLSRLRGQAQRALVAQLSPDQAGLAAALLLGEGSALTQDRWEQYIRSGVVHVLVISGQHMMILAGFLWVILRLAGCPRRLGAWLIVVLIVGYAELVGGRPPALRASVMIAVGCVGLYLGRPVLTANSLALAWILVALLQPTDLFTTGCQLSFISVAVLHFGIGRWRPAADDPLQRLIDESLPWWRQALRAAGYYLLAGYLVCGILWIVISPLVAARYHLVAPVALLIGFPMIVLTAISLLAGFVLLGMSFLMPPLAAVPAWVMSKSLGMSMGMVGAAGQLPLAHWYVGGVPDWWLITFYAVVFCYLAWPGVGFRLRRLVLIGLAWLCFGLVVGAVRSGQREFRCTFLAVGHGGCTVIESADGRTLLFDAGAMNGPDVTRRHIAPYLWHRGIRRIDELFLSHADLDHFNGVSALLERFAVGQVTWTPTFADRAMPGVRRTLEALADHGIPTRVVCAGDQLDAGPLRIEVLHPPMEGPDGKENYRSMVIRLCYEDLSILLTGDLEGPGLDRVLGLPAVPVDVMMAPHHGSRTANTPALADWARPKVVVACQGRQRSERSEPYSERGAWFLGTWPHGAVTIRTVQGQWQAETFATRRQRAVKPAQTTAER